MPPPTQALRRTFRAPAGDPAPVHYEYLPLKMHGMTAPIQRSTLLARIEQRFRSNRIVLPLGPRQCGKTTLARQFARRHRAECFDLEDPRDDARLAQPVAALEAHPKLGASWGGFAMEDVLHVTADREAYFWSAQSGAKLDLLVFHRGKRFGFEFKYADAPAVTKPLNVARHCLKLERAFVVSPGAKSNPLND
jgi:predicted AAA+ superfamily ATPase